MRLMLVDPPEVKGTPPTLTDRVPATEAAPEVLIVIDVIVPGMADVVNERAVAGLAAEPNCWPLVASYPQ